VVVLFWHCMAFWDSLDQAFLPIFMKDRIRIMRSFDFVTKTKTRSRGGLMFTLFGKSQLVLMNEERLAVYRDQYITMARKIGST
jgi:hypothetical protein